MYGWVLTSTSFLSLLAKECLHGILGKSLAEKELDFTYPKEVSSHCHKLSHCKNYSNTISTTINGTSNTLVTCDAKSF